MPTSGRWDLTWRLKSVKEVSFEGEHGNEPSCYTKNAAFLVQLTD
jgi:hypothetical protein